MIPAPPVLRETRPLRPEPAELRALLAAWCERGWLRALDATLADFLWRELPAADPLLILAAALASHQLGRGHVCLDLEATLADPGLALSLPPEGAGESAGVPLPGELLAGIGLARWLAALDCPELVGDGSTGTPLVRVGHRLYLQRYWRYEQQVREGIARRLEAMPAIAAGLDRAQVRSALACLFPAPPGAAEIDWQKLACALAARSAFAVITGGPGTGKTTTVLRLLALLQALALRGGAGRALRIRLAAPTGKAAARLNQAIAGAVAQLPLAGLAQAEVIRAAIPREVGTLHRLLGSRPDSRAFRHHAGNPLPVDVLVVDEASMVDLEMMAALLDALAPGARLVLIGDKDQLASVEAGAVLGQLCSRAQEARYSAATLDWLAQAGGLSLPGLAADPAGSALDQALAMLRVSHRFDAASGIGRLAAAVNAGRIDEVQEVRRAGAPDLGFLGAEALDGAGFDALVIDGRLPGRDGEAATGGYRRYLEVLRDARPADPAGPEAFDGWAEAVLRAHASFQVLCALRAGPWGLDGLNARIVQALCRAGLIAEADGWYAGRPVLVTRNDYALGLMNGDIGITLELPVAGARALRVAFAAGDGRGIKWVLPSRLQAVQTVYALTVHKSQGSEFGHVALALPDRPNPILTRELLYTGITRARDRFTLLAPGGDAVLGLAVERRVLRAGGLEVG